MNNKIFRVFCLLLVLTAVVSCRESADYPTDAKYLPVKLKGSSKWSIINLENGEAVVKDAFEMAPSAVVDDMFYVADSLGRISYYNIASPTTAINKEPYGSATLFNQGRAIVSRPGTSLIIIDPTGKEVAQLSPAIDRATMFTRSRAIVHSDNGRYGYIDLQGDSVTPVDMSYAAQFLYDDYAVTSHSASATDSVIGITAIDNKGRELFSVSNADYNLITPYFTGGVLPLTKAGTDSLVFLDSGGHEVENPVAAPKAIKDAGYKDGAQTRAGYYLALKGDRMGMVDKDNKVMIDFKYEALVDLSATRYVGRSDSICVLLDEKGKRVGKLEFTDFVTVNYNNFAVRGFVDTAVLAANLLQMFNDRHACGATKGSTLMDLNSLIGNDPAPFVGVKLLPQMMGPLAVVYNFEGDIARLVPGDEGSLPTPQFNLDDKVESVAMSYDLHQCPDATLQEMVKLLESALGTAGFVLDSNNIFRSESGTAVTMGYSNGVFNLRYYMNAQQAAPLPRTSRP